MKVPSVNRSALLRSLCLTVLCSYLLVFAGEPAKPAQNAADPNAQAAALPAESAGMKGYIDPKTREIIQPTPALQTVESVPVENMLSTSAEGLKEVRSEGRAGGYRMDLKGRFRSAMVVTVDAQGNQVVTCDEAPVVPPAEEQ